MDYFRTESPATFPGTYGSKPILPLDARPIHTSPPPTQQNQMRMPAHPQDIYPQYMQSQSAMYHPPQRQRQASAPTGWPGQDPSFMPHHQHQQQSQSQPYHHLLPYLDELISQRRISATATAFPPVSQQYGPQHQGQGRGPNGSFVNVGTSFFCRSPTPAARQRTAQACEKCRERKTKCTGGSPCARCSSRGLVCAYAPSREARNRGVTKGRHEKRDSNSDISPPDGPDTSDLAAHREAWERNTSITGYTPPSPKDSSQMALPQIATPIPSAPISIVESMSQYLSVPAQCYRDTQNDYDSGSSCPSSATSSHFSLGSSHGSSPTSVSSFAESATLSPLSLSLSLYPPELSDSSSPSSSGSSPGPGPSPLTILGLDGGEGVNDNKLEPNVHDRNVEPFTTNEEYYHYLANSETDTFEALSQSLGQLTYPEENQEKNGNFDGDMNGVMDSASAMLLADLLRDEVVS